MGAITIFFQPRSDLTLGFRFALLTVWSMCFESPQGSRQNRVTLLGAGSQYVASFDILKLGKVKYFGYLIFPLFYFFVTCDLITTP